MNTTVTEKHGGCSTKLLGYDLFVQFQGFYQGGWRYISKFWSVFTFSCQLEGRWWRRILFLFSIGEFFVILFYTLFSYFVFWNKNINIYFYILFRFKVEKKKTCFNLVLVSLLLSVPGLNNDAGMVFFGFDG